MPNTREKEKLIDIVCNAAQINGCIHSCNHPPCAMVSVIVDALIDNGVTVQKWIPVTERLPEKDTYTLVTTDGVVISAYWHNDRFYGFSAKGIATVGGVTHWMPLPEPPKGE